MHTFMVDWLVDYLCQWGCVLPGDVCLSVCLLATSRKTTDHTYMKISPEMFLWTGKTWSNLGNYLDLDPGIFGRIFQNYEIGQLFTVW